jgi:hypothetical protein
VSRGGEGLRAKVALAAALLSAGAAAIHGAVAGPHLDHYLPFGLLFVASALAQAAWSVLVLLAPSRRVFAAGAVGNAGIVGVWAVSRTTGLPFGPESGSPEPVAAIDVAATAFEVGIVAASGILLAARRGVATVWGFGTARFAAIGVAVVAGLTAAAFAATPGGAAGHHHAPAAAHGEPHRHATPAVASPKAARAADEASRPTARTAAPRAAKRRKSPPHAHAEPVPHAHATPHEHG